jgi:hypothetical protein
MALSRREQEISKGFFWVILLSGLLLPWGVGLWVKLTLQSQGSPTWPWVFFLHPGILLVEILVSAYWALPFTGLALLSRYGLERRLPFFNLAPMERLVCVALSFIVGVFKAIPLFKALFWKFHPISFLYPWFVWHGGMDMLAALLGGWVLLGTGKRVFKGK